MIVSITGPFLKACNPWLSAGLWCTNGKNQFQSLSEDSSRLRMARLVAPNIYRESVSSMVVVTIPGSWTCREGRPGLQTWVTPDLALADWRPPRSCCCCTFLDAFILSFGQCRCLGDTLVYVLKQPSLLSDVTNPQLRLCYSLFFMKVLQSNTN